MQDYPNMLLVGSTARNTGKTTFCSRFISKWKDIYDIIAVKVTTNHGEKGVCHRGGEGCGICTAMTEDFVISEEKNRDVNKDTSLLLASGAKRVFWVRAMSEHLPEAADALGVALSRGTVVVCESNALIKYVKPGVCVVTHGPQAAGQIKPSAAEMLKSADFTVDISQPNGMQAALDNIFIKKDQTGVTIVNMKRCE